MSRTIALAIMMAAGSTASFAAGDNGIGPGDRPIAGSGSFYSKSYFSKQPMHGYSGSPHRARGGRKSLGHCDYQRLPIRVCSGANGCSITGWELYQYCY